MYICLCKGLTEKDVQRVARTESITAEILIKELGLDDPRCCGRCARNVDDLLALARGEECRLRPVACVPLPQRLVPQSA